MDKSRPINPEKTPEMNEQDWLDSKDPHAMLGLLQEQPSSGAFPFCTCCRVKCSSRDGLCPCYRKLRLFAWACCRRVLHWFDNAVCSRALEIGELYVDGRVDAEPLLRVSAEFDSIRRARFPKQHRTDNDDAWTALYCAVHRRWEARFDDSLAYDRWRIAVSVSRDSSASEGEAEKEYHAHLLREVFGNPIRPTAFQPGWRTPAVRGLCDDIYEDRVLPEGTLDPDRLGILADALEDAGCTERSILDHCRSDEPHVRGCWVLDTIWMGESVPLR